MTRRVAAFLLLVVACAVAVHGKKENRLLGVEANAELGASAGVKSGRDMPGQGGDKPMPMPGQGGDKPMPMPGQGGDKPKPMPGQGGDKPMPMPGQGGDKPKPMPGQGGDKPKPVPGKGGDMPHKPPPKYQPKKQQPMYHYPQKVYQPTYKKVQPTYYCIYFYFNGHCPDKWYDHMKSAVEEYNHQYKSVYGCSFSDSAVHSKYNYGYNTYPQSQGGYICFKYESSPDDFWTWFYANPKYSVMGFPKPETDYCHYKIEQSYNLPTCEYTYY